MPLRLEIEKKFEQRSDNIVKSVDLHPTDPWIMVSLNSGTVCIWNYQEKTLVRSFAVTKLPVGSAKFIARKNWVVAGAHDNCIHVYNYNNGDKVAQIEAHAGVIRCVAVHANLPYVLSSSDDMLIRLWDWEKGWAQTQTFRGHSGTVMQVTFNPKDANAFASASLDSTVKIWNFGKNIPTCTLNGHKKGVNCVGYFPGGNTPYLITGSDDCTAKVWNYSQKSCVQTLEGHAKVSAVCVHHVLPIIITGSEDGSVCIWHSARYRLENTLAYGLERVSALSYSYLRESRRIVIGYDRGTIMVTLGSEAPVASLDENGTIIWSKYNEIQTVKVPSVKREDYHRHDGEILPFSSVENLDTDCLYPQSLKHSPNGEWVVVCGDDEYTIYRASKWEWMCTGQALEFVWSSKGEYAVWESNSTFKIFTKDRQEKKSTRADFSAEHIYGGTLLAICSKSFICFYNWTEFRLIWRIDLNVKNLYWAPQGEYRDMVAIVTDTSCRTLQYNRGVVSAHLGSGRLVNEQGIDNAFEELYKFEDQVLAGFWYGNSFVYTNSSWKLNFCLNAEVTEICHLDRPMYMLGLATNQICVYFIDKEYNVFRYTLPLDLIDFKYYAMRGDTEEAKECLQHIPEKYNNSLAHILEALGNIEEALGLATDPIYKSKLAKELHRRLLGEEVADAYDEPLLQDAWDQITAQNILWKDNAYGDTMRSEDTVHSYLKSQSSIDGKVYFTSDEVNVLAPASDGVDVAPASDRSVTVRHVTTNKDYLMLFIPAGDGTYTIGGPGWHDFYNIVAEALNAGLRFWFRKTGKRNPLVSLVSQEDSRMPDGCYTRNAPKSPSSSEDEEFDSDFTFDG